MNILIVYAHPEPKSFNGSIYRKAIETFSNAGHHVKTSDLYAMQFSPVTDRSNFKEVKDPIYFKQQVEEISATENNSFADLIDTEQQKIEWCDLMIWQFPLWWGSVPAILKGWVDRVFAMGRVYGQGHLYETGMFQGKKAMLSITVGGHPEMYLPDGYTGDIHAILRPITRGIFELVGFSVLATNIIYAPVRLTADEAVTVIADWQTRLEHIADEQPIVVGRY